MNKDAQTRGKESVLDELGALYGGMALICSNRLGPGRVNHSFAGLLTGGVAVSRGTAEEDKEAFLNLWKPTTVEVSYEDSLLRGRWRKCVWNLPFNGISVAMGGITVDVIVNDPGLRRLADTVMDETIAAANADLSSHGIPTSQYLGDEDVRAKPSPHALSWRLHLSHSCLFRHRNEQ
jgi:2-dehydropantoate 2-reductase